MDMATLAPVSLAEYLNTNYEPDCDYVDGVLEERNVGKRRHSETQALLSACLISEKGKHGYRVLTEQRVQVSPSRVRIPDICLVPTEARDETTQTPPLLCIEILSPEDRWSRVQDRLTDYLKFGVRTVWIIDPYSNEAWIATPETAAKPVEDGKLRCADLNLEILMVDILPRN
jgi:Uma2 family endonuclease